LLGTAKASVLEFAARLGVTDNVPDPDAEQSAVVVDTVNNYLRRAVVSIIHHALNEWMG